MSTFDQPLASRLTVAGVRRASAVVVLFCLVVALVAGTSGVIGHAREQARERAEHDQLVRERVRALAGDWRMEQSFLVASRRTALDARLTAVAAERAVIAASRDVALTNAAGVLASSAGKVDDGQRARLQAAVDVLSAPETVYSRVVAATGEVSRLVDEVSAAEVAWTAEQSRLANIAAAARHTVAPVAGAGRPGSAPAGTSVRDVGEATLRSLPGNAGVSIHWDDPGLGGHLGGVWSGSTDFIMVNSAALAGKPGKTADVVRHEIAHIYEGRLAAAFGLTWSELGNRMSAAFGANAQEKAADCVALRFGAAWTHYTSDCGSVDKQAWVDGMIGSYLP